jgi:hypothetical protein
MESIVAGALMALMVATAVRAQPATTLTLACTGTVKDNNLDFVEKVQTGVIVNFQTKQIIGLLGGWDSRIDRVDETAIDFSGISSRSKEFSPNMIHSGGGSIDRITGSLTASIFAWVGEKSITNYSVNLLCKPAQRLF